MRVDHRSSAAILQAKLQHRLEHLTVEKALSPYTSINNLRDRGTPQNAAFPLYTPTATFSKDCVHACKVRVKALKGI